MKFKHKSVMLDEVISGLAIKPQGIYVDGTIGGAGHSSVICEKLSEKGTLVGIDRDQDALDAAKERLESYKCKKHFIKDNYSNIGEILEEIGIDGIDGAVLDLGVSSFQLDNVQRGFSYMNNAPLDMRMSQDDAFSAYQVVNDYKEEDLKRVIKEYGEENFAPRIANQIAKQRKQSPVETTSQLVEIIKDAMPFSKETGDPKKRDRIYQAIRRTFQAIRIEVNDELGQLEKAVDAFCKVLKPEGRLCIITFHSLEDRIVKNVFNKHLNPCTCPKGLPICVCGKKPDIKKVSHKPITPKEEERLENSRSKSAKLRVITKLSI